VLTSPMLDPEQRTHADKYVQLFYNELAKAPRNRDGYLFLENDNTIRDAKMFAEFAGEKNPAFVKKQYAEIEEQTNKIEKDFAKYSGLDRFGIERLVTRMPVIFYVPLHKKGPRLTFSHHSIFDHNNQMESIFFSTEIRKTVQQFKDALEEERFEIGLDATILKTTNWNHSNMGGIRQGDGYNNPFENGITNMASHIEYGIGEKIQNLFTGVLYAGITPDNQQNILVFVDTSEATSFLKTNKNIMNNCAETVVRYGLDGLYSLYAESQTNREGRNREVSANAMLDPSDCTTFTINRDGLKTNIEFFDMTKIKQDWQEETFWRTLVQSYLAEGKFSQRDPDPEQSLRDIMRDAMLMQMERRANEILDAEIARASKRIHST
jgi:hypothetical protein